MKKAYLNALILILILLTIVLAAYFFSKEIATSKNIEVSDFVEVNDYQGKNFSLPDDFRENSIKGPQIVKIEDYKLNLTGLIENEIDYTYDQMISDFISYKKDATLNCVEGWSVNILWEGPLVSDVIKTAKIKPEANTIIFKAVDGYTTSFPLDYILDNKIIMAYNMNGEKLDAARGFPFQLVAESKWGYKWIKWISEIEISNDPEYKGYWESRGYSNTGDLDKSRFE